MIRSFIALGKSDEPPCLKEAGVTMMELLVAMALIGLIAGIGTTIFSTLLQAYSKAVIVNRLRSEGARVMEDISRVVRDADELEVYSGGAWVLSGSGERLRVTLHEDTLEYEENENCSQVTYILQEPVSQNGRVYKDLAGDDCPASPSQEGVLTDTNLVRGIDVYSLTFELSDGGLSHPDSVQITMVLRQGLQAPNREESAAEIEFKNTMSTRDY